MMAAEGVIHESQNTTEITSLDYVRALPQPPILSGIGQGWERLVLHRFEVPALDVELAPSNSHKVTVHLGGTVLIKRTCEGRHDRRWSDKGLTSLIPAGVPTTRSFQGKADFLVAFVDREVVSEVAESVFERDPDHVRLVESFAEKDETLEQLCYLMMAEAQSGNTGTRLYTDNMTRAIALHLLRSYSTNSLKLPVSAGVLAGWRLNRVVDYMHAHIDQNLPLHQLAATAGLSPSHFARAFRAATGEPPHRYLVRLRVEKARHLLELTRLPIIDISLQCGFDQSTHFATMFRKCVGLSPRAYRAARCT